MKIVVKDGEYSVDGIRCYVLKTDLGRTWGVMIEKTIYPAINFKTAVRMWRRG